MYFSKSKYCDLWKCPKMAWLNKYKPEEREIDDGAKQRMEDGNKIGDLAMGIFGDFVEVTELREDGSLDLPKMIVRTKEEMDKGTPVICEASFDFNGLYCAVDILKRDGDGWAIYEVKSTKDDNKAKYYVDVGYQKYVLERCGIAVTNTYLITLNGEYVFDGTLDIKKLFLITDISDPAEDQKVFVGPNLEEAEPMLNDEREPDIDLSVRCEKPGACPYWDYCARSIPSPSVFDLYRFDFKKKIDLYHDGIISFDALEKAGIKFSEINTRFIDYTLHDRGIFVDKECLSKFLKSLSYPLYFLDFESVMPALPEYVGTKPYTQICFQYSLHYIEEEGGELKHKEFLGEPEIDPRRALCEQLISDIPDDGSVIVFNNSFEGPRIKAMAEVYPDLAPELIRIASNIVDLLVPFRSGWYYKKEIANSFSIKSVLPALCPDDPALDYHALDQVHHGGEAMTIFPAMVNMTPEERARTRHNLLKYCELDTLAMVKVWEKLKEAVE